MRRDRSGRSGRRRGSQKPGTACGATVRSSARLCGARAVIAALQTSMPPATSRQPSVVARRQRINLSLTGWQSVVALTGAFRTEGLIDHPERDASTVCCVGASLGQAGSCRGWRLAAASGRVVPAGSPLPQSPVGVIHIPQSSNDNWLCDPEPGPPSELDCLRHVLAPALLSAAEARGREVGAGADQALIRSGVIDEDAYLQALSFHTGLAIETFADASRAIAFCLIVICPAPRNTGCFRCAGMGG